MIVQVVIKNEYGTFRACVEQETDLRMGRLEIEQTVELVQDAMRGALSAAGYTPETIAKYTGTQYGD